MMAGSQTIADDRRRSSAITIAGSQAIAEVCFHMMAGSQTIADDRRRSSAITIAGSQAIAEVCFHMIADDRRTFCDLRCAIRDRLRSYGNQP